MFWASTSQEFEMFGYFRSRSPVSHSGFERDLGLVSSGYLHSSRIIHRDIKPSNVMVSVAWASFSKPTLVCPHSPRISQMLIIAYRRLFGWGLMGVNVLCHCHSFLVCQVCLSDLRLLDFNVAKRLTEGGQCKAQIWKKQTFGSWVFDARSCRAKSLKTYQESWPLYKPHASSQRNEKLKLGCFRSYIGFYSLKQFRRTSNKPLQNLKRMRAHHSPWLLGASPQVPWRWQAPDFTLHRRSLMVSHHQKQMMSLGPLHFKNMFNAKKS